MSPISRTLWEYYNLSLKKPVPHKQRLQKVQEISTPWQWSSPKIYLIMYIHPQGRQLNPKKFGCITRLLETLWDFMRHQDLKASMFKTLRPKKISGVQVHPPVWCPCTSYIQTKLYVLHIILHTTYKSKPNCSHKNVGRS